MKFKRSHINVAFIFIFYFILYDLSFLLIMGRLI